MRNIVNVRIFNRPYSLSTDETESYIKKIAAIVDEKMKANVSGNINTNVIDAAIITALEAVDEKQKALATIDNLRTQIKDYVDDAGEARLKCDEAQKELRALKAKCAELEKEVEIRRMFNKKREAEAAVKAAEEQAKKEAAIKAEAEKKAMEAAKAAKFEADAKAAAALEDAKAKARAKAALEEAKAKAAAKLAAQKSAELPKSTVTSGSAYTIPDAVKPGGIKV